MNIARLLIVSERSKLVLCVAFLCAWGIGVFAANASIIEVNFDENGNGSWNGQTMTGVLASDPTGRLAGNVLVYSMPDGIVVQPGDVAVFDQSFNGDPGDPSNVLSDVVTFTGNKIVLYSLAGGTDLADTGLPTVSPLDMPGVIEYEGAAFWFSNLQDSPPPSPGDLPGLEYAPMENGILYTITSGEVPEPATAINCLILATLAIGLIWRRKRAA
jgi:hypothetical protein